MQSVDRVARCQVDVSTGKPMADGGPESAMAVVERCSVGRGRGGEGTRAQRGTAAVARL